MTSEQPHTNEAEEKISAEKQPVFFDVLTGEQIDNIKNGIVDKVS